MKKSNIIQLEVGDIAHCPYYNYTGIITEIKPNQFPEHPNHIVLVNPSLGEDKNNRCVTKIKTVSVNSPTPSYLQLVMKKEDYNNIGKLTVFGHPKIN